VVGMGVAVKKTAFWGGFFWVVEETDWHVFNLFGLFISGTNLYSFIYVANSVETSWAHTVVECVSFATRRDYEQCIIKP
jgi:hypothetical protein